MNPDTLTQLLQKGFRVTLGATASLMEILQDPLKRDENLSKLSSEFQQLAEEWAEKGEVTEQEARNFVETILKKQQSSDTSGTGTAADAPITTVATPVSDGNAQSEIQDLTSQIAALRTELEKLRNQE